MNTKKEETMNDVIHLGKTTRRYYTARELLDVLQTEWLPDDELSLMEFCNAVEERVGQ